VLHRADPLNRETSIPSMRGGIITPNARFYVRNHFPIPQLDPSSWQLKVAGSVERPLALTLQDLHTMRSESLVVTLECAGNGRSMLRPTVAGEQWGLGAVSTAEWTGVPLLEVLERAGIGADAREVLFRGADTGPVEGHTENAHFERSLKLDEIRNSSALLAYGMNGAPLPFQHGYPLRLIVPGWYGVASVKWLTAVEVLDVAFSGHFQSERYVYEWQRNGQVVREPVRLQRVRALITEPGRDQHVEPGDVAVRGLAWSGMAPISRVDVSIGGGTWREAQLLGERSRDRWQKWELIVRLDRPCKTTLRARATDLTGSTQPRQPEWNRLGYGSNAIQDVPLRIR
jgi:DMSO/TMAO reductase YedYZ molybdopterin-dependent catalytic subunit